MAATDPDVQRRRSEAFGRIVQWGDPVLRTPAREVDRFDGALRRQADEMTALMEDAQGVGLAAPQIGIPNRVLVYRAEAGAPVRALVNPVVEEASEERVRGYEGCLSLARGGVVVEVERAVSVVVAALDVDGTEIRIEAEDHHARVLQHEIDHLDGILTLARTEPLQRREAVRALREGVPYFPTPAAGDADAA